MARDSHVDLGLVGTRSVQNLMINKYARLLFALTGLVFLFVACETGFEPDEAHPVGVVFFNSSGIEVARFVSLSSVTGELSAGIGQTATYDVRVLTDDGNIIPIDGVEYSIDDVSLVIPRAATVSITGQDRITLVGGAARLTTSVTFELIHVGHVEFRVRDVPVRVQ